MHFIDDVNFIFTRGGGIADGLIDLADIVDAAVRRSIDFEDIERPPCDNV